MEKDQKTVRLVKSGFINIMMTYRSRNGLSSGFRLGWANSPVSRQSMKNCNRENDKKSKCQLEQLIHSDND